MYAKSIIEHVVARLAAGAWTQQLSFVPVVMALAVASLPFTLETRVDASTLYRAAGASNASDAPAADEPTVSNTPVNSSMVKTAANATAAAALEERRYTLVAEYMARKFFVSRQVVLDLVKTAHSVGRQYNVDPMLLVAVISIESSFNPIAESVVGAKGLMQIIPHFHLEKFTEFGGEHAIFDPRTNIAVGAKIIREYLQNSSGNLFTAMQTYGGALADRDASYTHKVLNEKDRLDTLLGLTKTNRSGFAEYVTATAAPAAGPAPAKAPEVEQSKERVQIMIPPRPAPAETTLLEPPRVTKPVAPAAVPVPVAVLRIQ